MAHYLVRAKAIQELMPKLKARLDSHEIKEMRPFGTSLDYSLNNARIDAGGWIVWEEEDYCTPPLAMERAAVLDTYFTDLSVEQVKDRAGWQRIKHLPHLWQ